MKFLRTEAFLGAAEGPEDAVRSSEVLDARLTALRRQAAALPDDSPVEERRRLALEAGYVLIDLDRREEAWGELLPVFHEAIADEAWQQAVEAADILFQADRPDSVKALAHGIWLAVTYPIDPELTVAMLHHLIEETPERSDGAAVAAATARYVVDVRADGRQREDLLFFTGQLLGDVARRHSKVDEQEVFDFWVERLELNEPGKFLPRMSKVLEVIVADDWWFDRDALRARIPQ